MEKTGNRYRNPVRLSSVFRIIFIVGLLGLVGGAFVYARNHHVKQGDKIRGLEHEIAELDQEVELWELRNAAAKDRSELLERLKWSGSELVPIDPSKVLRIEVKSGGANKADPIPKQVE